MAPAPTLARPLLSALPDPLAFEALCRSASGPLHDYLEKARATLRAMISRPELLDDLPLLREAGRYTRTLLYGDEQVSLWALLWPPGVRTCIHDHHCSCCFGVARGVLTERWFRPVGDRQAIVSAVAQREPGFVAAMLPTGPNIHQMLNETDQDVVSVHLYGFDHRRHASSIDRQYDEVAG